MRRSVSFPVTPVIALALIGVIFGFIGLVFLLISNSAKQKAEAAQA